MGGRRVGVGASLTVVDQGARKTTLGQDGGTGVLTGCCGSISSAVR